MNSSGTMRGLSALAVSALAVTALPVLAGQASAQPLTGELAPNAVKLYSQASNVMSTKNDGRNQTVRLLAGGGTDVTQVRFAYRIGDAGAVQTIATVGRSSGAFSTEWAPPANLVGSPLTLIITGLDAAGATVGAPVSKSGLSFNPTTDSVDLTNAPGSAVGAFEQPYAAAGNRTLATASGTTSGTTPELQNLSRPGGPGPATAADTVSAADANGVRTFSGVVDLTGYVIDTSASAVNEVVVGALEGSDDAEALMLYRQSIQEITANAADTSIPEGSTTTVTVRVLDQSGHPIAGARVGERQDGDSTGFTNSKGEFVFTGVGAGPGKSYYADTSAVEGFQEGTDFRTLEPVTITSYTPVLTTLTATSADGPAFDRDENAAGDLKLTGRDQEGREMSLPPTTTRGTWTITPFGSTTSTTQPAAVDPMTGNVSLPLNAPDGTYVLDAYVDRDGTPGRSAGDLAAAPLSIKVGEAAIRWDDADNLVQLPAGSSTTRTGTLELADGTDLGGRTGTIELRPGTDARLATAQPAGTTRTSPTAGTWTTANDGTFRVAVEDPAATPQPKETARLDAASAPLGIALADTPDLVLEFLDVAVRNLTFSAPTNLVDNQATPGRPVSYTLTVTNAAGDVLKGVPVALTLDRGFFTTYAANAAALTPATTPTADAPYGVWKKEGTTKSLTTDQAGQVKVTVAIEKDVELDDDGRAPVTLTAAASGVSVQRETVFESKNPLNVASLSLEFAEDGQDSRVLPKARTGTEALIEVFAKDQFGNLTRTPVSVADGTSPATFTPATGILSNFTDEAPALTATSAQATAQKLDGLADNTTVNKYADSDPITPGFQPGRDSSTTVDRADDVSVTWYALDLARSTFAMTDDGDAFNPVGSTVVMTYTATDQEGNPIDGRPVQFFRAGPGGQSDSDGADNQGTTDADGRATYVFQGSREGTATISGFLVEGSSPIASTKAERRVVFGSEPVRVATSLQGANNGRRADVLRVTTGPAADGATVRLFRVTADGRKRVAVGTLDGSGAETFVVPDRNGRRATKYVAVVAPTSDTLKSTSNVRRVR